ncbi:MAG TPA: serine/threonine-protein kinase, partial [Rhodothermia bacterium]
MEGQSAPDPFDITGTRFSHYQVREHVGSGGMGLVYEAEDVRLGRLVALKVLPPWSRFDPDARTRFFREAKAASSLNHPNICTIYEYDVVEDRPFIAMELVEGETLLERNKAGLVPRAQAIAILSSVAAGLEHAHERDIVHRDIKPGNILLGADGRIKIADFGLARLSDTTTITRSGATLGTVAYMSPEQALGEKVTATTDVWSLGVLVFETLTGNRPFRAEHASALIYQILNTEPVGLDALAESHGAEIADIVARCLEKDPSRRPSAAEIRTMASALVVPDVPAAPTVQALATGRRRRRRWIAAAACLIAALVGLAFFVTSVKPSIEHRLRTSTLAFVPPVVADSSLQLALRGLLESSFRDVSGPAVERALVGHIAPFADDQVAETLESAGDVHRILGIPFAVTTEVVRRGSRTTLSLSLVDTGSLETLRNEHVIVDTDKIQDSRRLVSEAIGRLVGLEDAPAGEYSDTHIAPGSAEFYNQGLGLLQYRSGPSSVTGAIALFERAVEASPNFAPAFAELGRAYLLRFEETKDPQLLARAERLCDRALEMDPGNQSVHITLGRIHLAEGQYGRATMEFDRALGSARHSVDALLGKARVFNEQGQYREAESMYKQAIAKRPDYWPGYRELALFYYYQGRYLDAVSQFEIVAQLAPLNPLGYRGMGSSYYNLELFQLARESWEKALEIADDHSTYSNLGTLNFYLEDYSGAAAALEKAISLDSNDYVVWSNLAMAYHYLPNKQERFEEAARKTVELAEELLDLNPNDDFVRARIAGVHTMLGDTATAYRYLEPYLGNPAAELTGETV